jgi:hypothetical protein
MTMIDFSLRALVVSTHNSHFLLSTSTQIRRSLDMCYSQINECGSLLLFGPWEFQFSVFAFSEDAFAHRKQISTMCPYGSNGPNSPYLFEILSPKVHRSLLCVPLDLMTMIYFGSLPRVHKFLLRVLLNHMTTIDFSFQGFGVSTLNSYSLCRTSTRS